MPQISPDKADNLLVVLTTLPSMEAATTLAKALVEMHLAACVQITGGMQSVYRWEGKVCEAQEVMLSIKTIASKWESISSYIKEGHPYNLPEILAFTPEQYEHQYGQWVKSEVNCKT